MPSLPQEFGKVLTGRQLSKEAGGAHRDSVKDKGHGAADPGTLGKHTLQPPSGNCPGNQARLHRVEDSSIFSAPTFKETSKAWRG